MTAAVIPLFQARLDWEEIARINVRCELKHVDLAGDRRHQAAERAARNVRAGVQHDIAVRRAVAWALCADPAPPRVA